MAGEPRCSQPQHQRERPLISASTNHRSRPLSVDDADSNIEIHRPHDRAGKPVRDMNFIIEGHVREVVHAQHPPLRVPLPLPAPRLLPQSPASMAPRSTSMITIEPEIDHEPSEPQPRRDVSGDHAPARPKEAQLVGQNADPTSLPPKKTKKARTELKQALSATRLRHSSPGRKTSVAVACRITALTSATLVMRKTFSLDESGVVKGVAGANALRFRFDQSHVCGIEELGAFVEECSRNPRAILIRGAPEPGLIGEVQRFGNNFPEPPEGCCWVMLDFDNIIGPEGMSPTSREAIEHLISKLPAPFRNTSYFFQFSSSAGIRHADGSLFKMGINVHIFFWFDRPVPGKALAAYLRIDCIRTGFYTKTHNALDVPRLVYSIDASVIKSSVQPHFVALPSIGTGVACDLTFDQRQGLVRKMTDAVALPDLDDNIVAMDYGMHRQLDDEWKRECGYRCKTLLAKPRQGSVAATTYYANPDAGSVRTGRALVRVDEPKTLQHRNGGAVSSVRLYLEGESSPGSWYVLDRTPTLARRYGDGTTIALKELSPDAHDHVRDRLEWFQEVVVNELALTPEGYLPAFDTFVTAKYSLVLAPTGSGKTTAFCDFALARRSRAVIVYAAQTIALTRQMQADLMARRVPVVHYQDFNRCAAIVSCVYVTTNESLGKIIDAIKWEGKKFIFVVDEAHIAIDDFMRTNKRNRLFEDTLLRAEKTIFMTGTMTTLQRQKIADTVALTPGGLASENFNCYEFASVREYPLFWVRQAQFGPDLVALMRSHEAMKKRGVPLPRVVVIASTSAMKRFELTLEYFGLTDDAVVVSREEAKPSEIELARISTLPWLISSPLFALGLNFECAPTLLMATFESLADLDTSQIIQTLNRANRTGLPCEVRVYAGFPDETPFTVVNAARERERLEEFFIDESNIVGDIDPHFHLDRATYNEVRGQQERVTAKSLHVLLRDDAVQNYRIVDMPPDNLPREADDADLFRGIKRSARDAYKAEVAPHVPLPGTQTMSGLAYMLKGLRDSHRELAFNDQAPKESNDQELGLLTALTGNLKHMAKNSAPDAVSILRLLAEEPPYTSSQYDTRNGSRGNAVKAQKVREMIPIVDLLERLRNGDIDGVEFGKKMRLKVPRRGVLALAKGEADYVSWNKKLEAMDQDHERYKCNASPAMRGAIDDDFFVVARGFLEGIGVTFDKSKKKSGRDCIDSEKPVVPSWDLDRVRLALEIKAASLEHLPDDLEQPWIEAQKCAGGPVKLELCQTCVHCDLDGVCHLGRLNQAAWETESSTEDECDAFVALPASLRAKKVAWVNPQNSEKSWVGKSLRSPATFEVEGSPNPYR